MRPSLTLLALGCCLVLWLVGLWHGRPWPITLALQIPRSVRTVESGSPPVQASPDVRAPVQATGPLTLTPKAGTATTQRTLSCQATQLTVHVTQPLGTRRGLDAVAIGWPQREDGWGLLAPDGAPAPLTLTGRGLVAASTLQLTSLGGLFDGTGAVEVTPVCLD